MERIIVSKSDAKDEYEVSVGGSGGTRHVVTLDEKYWQKLTGGEITPEDLIEKSFRFVLDREDKKQVLKKFHLKVIGKYFPEYEGEIKKTF